ncbi:MAG: hypothetical protein AAF614_32660 [Chloroflexota bacterium]
MIDAIEIPTKLLRFNLPAGVEARLQQLLTRQDSGEQLTTAERQEAEDLVELAEFLSLLQLRTQRTMPSDN